MLNNIGRTLVLGLIISMLFLAVDAVPAMAKPYVLTRHFCLMDGETGQVLLSNNADVIRPVASTTKMMTAILAREYADLQEIAVISENADHTPEYTIGLREGQRLSVAELLKVALMRSANDAAVALAEHVAGNERFFGHLMSVKAVLIGAQNTHFTNSSGLPDEEHNSTAYDMALIGRYLLSDPCLQEIVATRSAPFDHPGYGQPLTIRNTNALLSTYPGADGIKTGTTDAAGKCLVASATRNGRQLLAVALRSPDRNGDCLRMLQYGYNGMKREKIVDKSVVIKEIAVLDGRSHQVDIYPEKDLYLWLEDPGSIEKKVFCAYEVPAPIIKGQKVGILQVYCQGKLVDNIRLISNDDINVSNGLSRFVDWVKTHICQAISCPG